MQPQAWKNVGQWCTVCVFISMEWGEFAAAPKGRIVYYVKASQDAIWKKIIAAWPRFLSQLGRKKNSSTGQFLEQRQTSVLNSVQGSNSLDIFPFPVLLLFSLKRVVLHYLRFPISCPNPYKLLFLSSSVCFSLRWELLLILLVQISV